MTTTMNPNTFEKAHPLYLPEILILLGSVLPSNDLSRASGGKLLVFRQVKKTNPKQLY
jgi:hypothetical protein